MNLLLADLHKFVNYSGGIEHVLSRMAFAMEEKGYHLSVVMADEKEGAPFYPFPKDCHFYNLFHMAGMKPVHMGSLDKGLREITRLFSKSGARERNYKMLSAAAPQLEQVLALEKPDVIISFREPTGRLLLEGLSTTVPVISMLHNDPDEIFAHAPAKEIKALEKSARIQALMPSFIQKAEKYLRYHHFVYIPNAVSIPAVSARPGAPRKIHTITNVGRVTGRTKRQHLLVEAFTLLAKDFPDWQVCLWGDTYDKTYVTTLKGMIKKAGLESRVLLKGTTKDMASVWKETDIFAFPSHHEGFPLALTEAMGVGIPAVGYRSCPAVNELIHDGEDGYLTEDGAAPLAEALRKLMEDGDRRAAFGQRAKENMKPFAPEVVWGEWDRLIREVVGEG
jgi:glycosyltransferase involved in cell wall biosynthesis